MTKITYVANVRLPTEKAHGVQIMNMCKAFSESGHQVELIIPWRFNDIRESPFEYYDMQAEFAITKIPSVDLISLGRIGFWLQTLTFSVSVFWYTLFRRSNVVYSRNELPLLFLSWTKKNLVLEVHSNRWNKIVQTASACVDSIVTITQGIKGFLTDRGLSADKIMVAHDAVDLGKFSVTESKQKLRDRLDLSQNKKLVGYVGMLRTMGESNGVGDVLRAIKSLEDQVRFVIVGGKNPGIQFYKNKAEELGVRDRVLFVGRVPYEQVGLYMHALDVLVAPYPDTEHYRKYMSPLKIFEYMASGVPIVASDLPSIREVLGEHNAFLVAPENNEAIKLGIKKALRDGSKKATQAQKDVKKYTWKKRAEKILNFVKGEMP